MDHDSVSRRLVAVTLAVASPIILLFAACGSDEPETALDQVEEALAEVEADPEDRYDASFVGTVEGTDALIGLTPYEGNLLAYVCDGDPRQLDADSEDMVSAWFNGRVVDGRFDLAGGDPALRLAGEQTTTGFTGTVTLEDGTVHAFTAVAAEDDEGLYREWIESGGEQAGVLDIGWVAFDGVTTGAGQPAVLG